MTGIDALDPRFPIALTSEAPLFWSSLRPWWSHSSKFAMAESERAGKQAGQQEVFVMATPPLMTQEGLRARWKRLQAEGWRPVPPEDEDLPVTTFTRPVPYPPLAPDALEATFEPLAPLPEMIP